MKPVNEQTIFITGATDGIGKLTALQLAKQHAHVLIHGRNGQKVDRVVEALKQESGNNNIEGFVADLSAMAEVRALTDKVVTRHRAIDVLINNAGVGFADKRYGKDGT